MNTDKTKILSKEEAIEINKKLLEASESYYVHKKEIMRNIEYDALYDKIVEYEKENGILEDSITQFVGFKPVSELETDTHEQKALSLDKTKDVEVLEEWLGDQNGCLSWKLDGLTIVATYDSGKLTKAVTRGDGIIGEIITHNARHFKGLPQKIKYDEHLVVRGEATISYSEFERINSAIEDIDDKYENPRNLVSGTIRKLDPSESKEREVEFHGFELVTSGSTLPTNSFCESLDWMENQGFSVVEHVLVNKDNLAEKIKEFGDKIEEYDIPSDGLVVILDDIAYGRSLGCTVKYPRNGMAFKWQDELKETTITDIKWQTSRTGLINPVVVYEPVRLEGTTITNATGNNISMMEEKGIAIGSKILVYKANKIIPTIDSVTEHHGTLVIPDKCPVCQMPAVIKIAKSGTKTLNCTNPECIAKHIKIFDHFGSKKAMNIKGLSDATIEAFIGAGFIKTFADIYDLDSYKDKIIKMPRQGLKSFERLWKSIQKSRTVELSHFIYALGISNVGIDASNKIAACCNNNYDTFIEKLDCDFDFSTLDGIGEVINKSLYDWYTTLKNPKNKNDFTNLVSKLTFKVPDAPIVAGNKLAGMKFVIHGTFEDFANKKAIEDFIKSNGGAVVGSVSNATSYVLSDDVDAKSGKTDKAKSLGVPIITGKQLIELTK